MFFFTPRYNASNPVDIYLFKDSNGNIKTMCEIGPNLILNTTEQPH